MHNNRNFFLKTAAILAVVMILAAGFLAWHRHAAGREKISYTSFISKVTAGEIGKVEMQGSALTAYGKTGTIYLLHHPPQDANLPKLLLENNVDLLVAPPSLQVGWIQLLIVLIVIAPLLLVMKKMAVFGKSRAGRASASRSGTLFADVAGAEEAKADLQDTIEFLKDPTKFSKLGGKMPTGVLLVGPPGTGKTLLARAVAGEAGAPFFFMSGSEFVEMYVGVGASRVRDLFTQAKKTSPCIVFIDELDAVGRRRDSGGGGASDERDQTLNQLLVEMDGFDANPGIVVMAATNRPEILDPALLRPGRFDRQVVVGAPDVRGREGILKVHTRTIPLASDVDLKLVARGTPGMSGADLANMANEAAILAARLNKKSVDMADFDAARDKVLMGAEKKSMVLSERSKLTTAWHEAGHVMVAKLVQGCDPVHKVSIVPRGRALGVTLQIPEEDIHCYTREMLVRHLKVLMGGRAAEELAFQTTTTGAGNDLARATETARKMVCEWGMSGKFGPVAFGGQEPGATNEPGPRNSGAFSDATGREIDSEIRSIVTSAYDDVFALLRANRAAMERLVSELMAKETLTSSEIDAVLGGLCAKTAE